MPGDRITHWCHECNRAVRPRRSGVCPNCNGGFVHEFDGAPTTMGQGVEPAAAAAEPQLEDLVNNLSLNGSRSPAPPSRDCLEISQKHLRGDSQCPVCMEKFELGMRVPEMPCKHLFHRECIVPWLTRHNTCPVCRREVGLPEVGRREVGGNGPVDQGWMDALARFWPFGYPGLWPE